MAQLLFKKRFSDLDASLDPFLLLHYFLHAFMGKTLQQIILDA